MNLKPAIALALVAVAVGIAAGVYVLSGPKWRPPAAADHKAGGSASGIPAGRGPTVYKTVALPASAPAGPKDWPIFRGTPDLTGRAGGTLPDQLRRLWSFKTGSAIKSSCVIAGGVVYIGSNDGQVYALDAGTGRKLWDYKTGASVQAPPCVLEGVVYVGSDDQALHAISASDGRGLWKFTTDNKVVGSANCFRRPDGALTILAGSWDHNLYALDARTGRKLWAVETGERVNCAPAVGEGLAVFGGCDAKVHFVSLAEGKQTADIDLGPEGYTASSPALADGKIYLGHYGGQLVRLDAATGAIDWRYSNPDGKPFFSSPAVGAGRVVVGCCDGRLYCLEDATGEPLWSFATGGEVDSSPVICADKVVFGSSDGTLYVVALTDGRLIWSYELGAAVASSPAVAGGRLVVGCDDGGVYAFGE